MVGVGKISYQNSLGYFDQMTFCNCVSWVFYLIIVSYFATTLPGPY